MKDDSRLIKSGVLTISSAADSFVDAENAVLTYDQ